MEMEFSSRHTRSYWSEILLLAGMLTTSSVALAEVTCGAASGPDRDPDEVAYIGESVSSLGEWPRSSGWGLSYRKALAPCFAVSLAYLNDGHFPGHHRDGVTAEAWLPLHLSQRLTLSAGTGPFYYYDTTTANNRAGYADVHDWAWLYSLDLIYQPWDKFGLFFDLRLDHTAPARSIETTSLGLGIGWRSVSEFDQGHDTPGTSGFADNEVTGYYYKTVVNSLSSQTSHAQEVEYRVRLWEELRASIGFLNEGNAQLIRRDGFLGELWAEPNFNSGFWSIGAGIGIYSAIDKYRASPGRHISDVVSATVSMRPLMSLGIDRLAVRFTWHRIVTDYNRDTDIVLWGLGYRF